MKYLIFLIFLSISQISYSQWVNKNVDNKIDEPYKITYCYSNNKTGVIKLENVGGKVGFYISGGYYCDDYPYIDMALNVNGETKIYTFSGIKSTDSHTLFIIDDILTEYPDFLEHFKKSSSLLMRIDETHCTDNYYEFNISGSNKAVEFISKY